MLAISLQPMTVTHRINCTKQTIVRRKHDHQRKKKKSSNKAHKEGGCELIMTPV